MPPCSVAKATWSPRRTAAGATACRSARAHRCAPMCRWCWWRATGATRLEQLSGRTIPLPAGSAAERHRTGQPAPGATPHGTDPDRKLDASLAVEDVMEMVQAGILGFTVVEQPIAERWARCCRNCASTATWCWTIAPTWPGTCAAMPAPCARPSTASSPTTARRPTRTWLSSASTGAPTRSATPRRGGPQAPGSGPSTAAALRAAEQHGLAGGGGGLQGSHLNPKARGSGGASG